MHTRDAASGVKDGSSDPIKAATERGLWGKVKNLNVIPDGVSRVPGLLPQSPTGSPLSADAPAGMTQLRGRPLDNPQPDR
jgi:hypothetical protein